MLFNMALKNGNLISIDEVISGQYCGCFCPVCNSPLVARKGKERVHHFAHYNSSECESYGESMLHLLAKKIIEENKYIIVPDFDKEVGKYSNFKKIELIKTEVEKDYNDIKPDIIGWVDGENYFFVEIAVTHKVDYEKLLKIREYNVSTLEIDLGGYYRSNKTFDYDIFKEILLSGLSNKRWIFDRKYWSKLEKYKQSLKKIRDKEKIERENQKKVEEENRLLREEVSKIRIKAAFEKYINNEIIGFLWEDESVSLNGGLIYSGIKYDIIVNKNPFKIYLARPHIELRLNGKNKQFQKRGYFILDKGHIKIFQDEIDVILEQNKSKNSQQSPDYFIKRKLSEAELLKKNEVIEVEKSYFCRSCRAYFSKEDMGEYQLDTKVGKCRICLNPDLQTNKRSKDE